MKSKTKIENQLRKKTNPELAKTIILAKSNPAWLDVASALTSPAKQMPQINIDRINKEESDTIAIPGKVLSQGELTRKVKVIAFKFSKKAKEKIEKSGSKVVSFLDEIENNKDAKGVKILK